MEFVECTPKKYKITARPIFEVTAYQVGNRIFKTKRGAVKLEAWRMICAKYAELSYNDSGLHLLDEFRGMTCDCKLSSNWSNEKAGNCPIHNKYTGYFARLHRRLVRFMMKFPADQKGI